MTRLLMCEPRYYGVEYEINPWMNVRRPVDRERVEKQWKALYDLLTLKLGASVELVPQTKGLPDQVFTANAGLVDGNRAVVSNFRYPQRAKEQPLFETWFKDHGFTVLTLPGVEHFEGEGDAFIHGGMIFAGHPFRSDAASHKSLSQLLGKPVVSLELADPWFYHLDTCLCILGEGKAMYYPPAFAEGSRLAIESHFPECIALKEEEARLFACNSIVLGGNIVMNTGCDEAKRSLQEMGFAVHETATSEFIKAGGSTKCMALFLARKPGPGRRQFL